MIKKNKLVCDTKATFSNLENVQYFIKYINKEGCLDFYKCKVCQNFHTTSVADRKVIHQKREHAKKKKERVVIKKMKK
jgi:hypothetical protein